MTLIRNQKQEKMGRKYCYLNSVFYVFLLVSHLQKKLIRPGNIADGFVPVAKLSSKSAFILSTYSLCPICHAACSLS